MRRSGNCNVTNLSEYNSAIGGNLREIVLPQLINDLKKTLSRSETDTIKISEDLENLWLHMETLNKWEYLVAAKTKLALIKKLYTNSRISGCSTGSQTVKDSSKGNESPHIKDCSLDCRNCRIHFSVSAQNPQKCTPSKAKFNFEKLCSMDKG